VDVERRLFQRGFRSQISTGVKQLTSAAIEIRFNCESKHHISVMSSDGGIGRSVPRSNHDCLHFSKKKKEKKKMNKNSLALTGYTRFSGQFFAFLG
jgi:hypothetical protein